jgi:hypothetical protein
VTSAGVGSHMLLTDYCGSHELYLGHFPEIRASRLCVSSCLSEAYGFMLVLAKARIGLALALIFMFLGNDKGLTQPCS